MNEQLDYIAEKLLEERGRVRIYGEEWPSQEAHFLRQQLAARIHSSSQGSNWAWGAALSVAAAWGGLVYVIAIVGMHRELSPVEYLVYVGSIAGAAWFGSLRGAEHKADQLRNHYRDYLDLNFD